MPNLEIIYKNYLYFNVDNNVTNNILNTSLDLLNLVDNNINIPNDVICCIFELSDNISKKSATDKTINYLFERLSICLSKYEYNDEFNEFMEAVNLTDEIRNESKIEKEISISNETSTIDETNIDELLHNRPEQDTKKYYISSWIGI